MTKSIPWESQKNCTVEKVFIDQTYLKSQVKVSTSFCSSLGRWISWFWMNSCSIKRKSLTRSNFSSLNLHFDVGKIWGIFTAAAGPFFLFLLATLPGAGFFFSFFSSSGLSPMLKHKLRLLVSILWTMPIPLITEETHYGTQSLRHREWHRECVPE